MAARSRGVLARLVPVLVTAALVVAMARRLDAGEMMRLLSDGRGPAGGGTWQVGWLGLAVALGPLQVGLAAERWRIGSRALAHPLTRGRAVREVALSNLLNQVLPGGVAGDAVRAWRSRDHAVALGAAARVVAVDRLVGLAVHLVVVIGGVLVWSSVHDAAAPWPIAGFCAALLLAFVSGLWFGGALGRDARRMLAGERGVAQVLISAVMTASFVLGFWACGQALGRSLGWQAITAVPIVLLSMALPLSVGGWGIREWTAALVLAPLGWSTEAAVLLSAAYGVSVAVGALPGALVPLLPSTAQSLEAQP